MGFTRTVYKAGAGKATARIAYLTGRTVYVRDMAQRQLQYLKEGREDLVAEGTRNLPAWAQGNPHRYFQAAEQYERASLNNDQRRGTAFEEWKITLPHELSRRQNQALVEDLLDSIAGDRLPCTYAFHAPQTLSGSREQPHIHLLISARINDGYVRAPTQHFMRYNRREPGTGGAQKDPAFWSKGAVKNHRVLIADIINVHLEAAGLAVRVHPETLKSQGILRLPEPKLLPSESAAYRVRGEVRGNMQTVLTSRAMRAQQSQDAQQSTRQYWEDRKTFLGITPAMPRAQQLAQILLRRHGDIVRIPARYRRLVIAGWAQSRQVARPRVPAPSLTRQFQRLARQVERAEEGQGRGHLRVRLQEEEQERGMSW